MASTSIKISLETKMKLDELRQPGQTYDGVIRVLIAYKTLATTEIRAPVSPSRGKRG